MINWIGETMGSHIFSHSWISLIQISATEIHIKLWPNLEAIGNISLSTKIKAGKPAGRKRCESQIKKSEKEG